MRCEFRNVQGLVEFYDLGDGCLRDAVVRKFDSGEKPVRFAVCVKVHVIATMWI